MAVSYLQLTQNAPCGTMVACAGAGLYSLARIPKAFNTGTNSVGIGTSVVSLNSFQKAPAVMFQINPVGVNWNAGNWTIRLNITNGNSLIRWVETWICRINSSCNTINSMGYATHNTSLQFSGVKTETVNVPNNEIPNSGDDVYIVLVFENLWSGVRSVTVNPNQFITSPFINTSDEKLIWIDALNRSMQKSDIDGNNVETILLGFNPDGITIDTSGAKVYFTNTTHSKIHRSDLNGSNLEDIISSGIIAPRGMDIDLVNNKIYWTDTADLGGFPTEDAKVCRSDLDGTNFEILLDFSDGMILPNSVAVNQISGIMYVTDHSTNKVYKANIDGSNLQAIVTSGLSGPRGVAIDYINNKIFFTDPGPSGIQEIDFDGSNRTVIIPNDDTSLNGIRQIVVNPVNNKIYWANGEINAIERSNLDGSNREMISSGIETPRGLALDLVNEQVYWTDVNQDRIQTCNFDGSGLFTIFDTTLLDARKLAIDSQNEYIYFTDAGADKIQRINIYGLGLTDILTSVSGISNPIGIDLDLINDKIYFTEINATGTIKRCNLDGSNIEVIVSGLNDPFAVRVDPNHNRIIWVNDVDNKISKADLNGSNIQDIVTGVGGLRDIVMDASGTKIYWGQRSNQTINTAFLDGSGVQAIITSGLNNPNGITYHQNDNKLYFNDTGNDHIYRSDTDGSNFEILVSSGLQSPQGIRIYG